MIVYRATNFSTTSEGKRLKRGPYAKGMAPGKVPGIRVALVVAAMLLAGCTSLAPSGTDSEDLAAPATLTAPSWVPGDSWHYVTEEGLWENWTVMEVAERGGHPVYEVEIRYSQPTEHFGTERATLWIDRSSLGIQAFREEDGFGYASDPPAFQVFPMINRTYDIRMSHFPQGSTTDLRLDSQVQGWHALQVPAGDLDVVQLAIHTKGMDGPPEYRWFSPEARNLAQYDNEGLFQLSFWSRG